MELALAGIPGAADGTMTARDFNLWYAYATKHGLPFHLLQLQLALIAFRIMRYLGHDSVSLKDFLIDKGNEDAPAANEDAELEAALRTFG